jgi:hypothetical protein
MGTVRTINFMLFSPYIFIVYSLIPTNVYFIISYFIHLYVNKYSTCFELYQFIIRTLYHYTSYIIFSDHIPNIVEDILSILSILMSTLYLV